VRVHVNKQARVERGVYSVQPAEGGESSFHRGPTGWASLVQLRKVRKKIVEVFAECGVRGFVGSAVSMFPVFTKWQEIEIAKQHGGTRMQGRKITKTP
jgi:hypothetical protein